VTPERREELQELRDEMAETLAVLNKLLEQPAADDEDVTSKAEPPADPVNRPSRAIVYNLRGKRDVAFKSGDAVMQKANAVLDSVNDLAAKMRRERYRY
jgi:hypothetical protein